METNLTTKRILIFLAFAFGIAWATALVIYLTGGLQNSPALAPGLSLALVLMAIPYMGAPAIANVATRLITREGWANTWLRPNFRRGWKFYLAAWLVPSVVVILGAAVYYLIFPQQFDPTLSALRETLAQNPASAAMDPWMVVIINTLSGFIGGITINAVFAFGEEFGWRAYLLPRLMERFGADAASGDPAPARKASLWMGLIWGVWHWPVIFMGYEYGFNYPGAPYLGPLVFCVFTTVVGIFLAWVTLRSGSVLPAAIGHGSVNGSAGIPSYFVSGAHNPLLGPLPIGLIGSIGYIALAVVLFISQKGLSPKEMARKTASEAVSAVS